MDRDQNPRFVVLGASNVRRNLATVVATAIGRLGSPLSSLMAIGHGRSYGNPSTVMARELPGIAPCGLWPALEAAAAPATWALVTDIGNDIPYGASPEAIGTWVETCLDRLVAADARLTVTQLPVDSIRGMSRLRFGLARRLLFPKHQIDLATVVARTEQTAEIIADLASRKGAHLVEPDPRWYGLDPVHIRIPCIAEAWGAFMADFGSEPAARLTRADRKALWRSRAEHDRRLGRARHTPQPCVRLSESTTIAMY